MSTNNYNYALLEAWRPNIYLQFTSNNQYQVYAYIQKYVKQLKTEEIDYSNYFEFLFKE